MNRRFARGLLLALLWVTPAAAARAKEDHDEHVLPVGSFPTRHRSGESEVGRQPWPVTVKHFGLTVGTEDLSRAFPAWVDVAGAAPRVLEGIASAAADEEYPGPHVSRDELPITHYTHDFTFHVRPDAAYRDLLGVQVHRDGHESFQETLECEWESGLGADNEGNPMSEPNRRGDSAGFFSAGHRRGQALWNWPTLGDHVHLEGRWIWDRGHPPADTEIHPPQLVATTRHLPVVVKVLADRLGLVPLHPVVATRVDIFASGDGGALWNNRPEAPAFVMRVPVGERDAVWDVAPVLPSPGARARLRAGWLTRPGDTGRVVPRLSPRPDGKPGLRVTLPWHSAGAPDDAIFARTLYLYWDAGDGTTPAAMPRAVRVTLDRIDFNKSQDVGPGQFRVFVEVGGTWLSANELVPAADVLREGLGHAEAGQRFVLGRSAVVLVPPGGSFRVHADGWEADGVNTSFGHLFDPLSPHNDASARWLNDNLFHWSVFFMGGRDDPAGEVNERYSARNRFGVGTHAVRSKGGLQKDVLSAQDADPNGTYVLNYHIEPCDWHSAPTPTGWLGN